MFKIKQNLFNALVRRLICSNKIKSWAESQVYTQAVIAFDKSVMRIDIPTQQLMSMNRHSPRKYSVSNLLKRLLILAPYKMSVPIGTGYIHQFGMGEISIQVESAIELDELCA